MTNIPFFSNDVLRYISNIFNWNRYIYKALIILSLSTCRTLYKFVNSSLDKSVKTFTLQQSEFKCNSAKQDAHSLSRKIYTELKSKLSTIFKYKESNGNISFKSEIIDYKITKIGNISEVTVQLSIIYIDNNGTEKKIPITKNEKLPEGSHIVNSKLINNLAWEIVDTLWSQTINKW